MILQRVMAIRQTAPDEDAEFVSFDFQMECSTSTYVSSALISTFLEDYLV